MSKLIAKLRGSRKSRLDEQPEMSFLGHLEELRWNIVKTVIGLIVASVGCAVFADYLVQEILMAPLRTAGVKAQVLKPYGIVLLYMQTVIVGGFILSMPNTLYWMWRFAAPGLLPRERRYISRIVALTSLCFFSGIAFAYFILLPTALNFFATFGTQHIDLNVAINHYIGFVLTLLVGAGLVFELPMISYFLAKMGILTPSFMRRYRRHSIVVILFLSALITPSPDIITQIMLAIPMFFLYEISIYVTKVASRPASELKGEQTTPNKDGNS